MKIRHLFSSVSLILLAGMPIAQANVVTLERVPEADRTGTQRVPANLAASKTGTRISPQNSAQTPADAPIIIGQDKSARLQLPSGLSHLPLELADLYSVNRVFFRSFSAAGRVRVIGADRPLPEGSSDWQELLPSTEFGPRQFLDQDFADQTLQFLVFIFEISVPGEISPLGITGEEFIDQASAQPPTAEQLDELSESEKASLVPYDFASIVNGSGVTLISSGPIAGANTMIDDDVTTYYDFEADDPTNTMLLDLRARYRVNRLALSLEAPAGTLRIYAFNVLPEQFREGAEGNEGSEPISLDAAFFDSVFPVASRAFEDAVEVAELDFDDVDVRYALLQWTPADSAASQTAPLRIFELSLIGMIPDGMADFRLVPSAEFAGIDLINGGIPIPTPEPIPVEIPPATSPR